MLKLIYDMAPAKVLIFGLGHDSAWYIAANQGGRTVFIEDSAEWIRQIQAQGLTRGAEVYNYTYWTDHAKTFSYLDDLKNIGRMDMALSNTLPTNITDDGVLWDFVLIDAPRAYRKYPGRMQPIVTIGKWIKAGMRRLD